MQLVRPVLMDVGCMDSPGNDGERGVMTFVIHVMVGGVRCVSGNKTSKPSHRGVGAITVVVLATSRETADGIKRSWRGAEEKAEESSAV